MSFGISIGDIVLCSQIAYRLFSAVTDGRKDAPRDLRELEDSLFGLYCALNHLQRNHRIILGRATTIPTDEAIQMKQQLGYMIDSCRQTLQELDDVTAKYRDAADDPSCTVPQNQYNVTGVCFSQNFKDHFKVQWRRVVWDLRGESLSKYRSRLQSHTDAINLLLSTLIWSATDRIEENGVHHAQRMNDLVHEASRFNNTISQFMQSFHATATALQNVPDSPSSLPSSGRGPVAPLAITNFSLVPGAGSAGNRSIASNPSARPIASASWSPRPGPSVSAQSSQPPSTFSVWPNSLRLQLPKSIEVINESRQVVGAKEFGEHRQRLARTAKTPQQAESRHSRPDISVRAIQQLHRRLEHVFQTLNVPTGSRNTSDDDLRTDIVDWVSKLDHLSDQLLSSPPAFSKQELDGVISDLVPLLVTLNRLLEESQERSRSAFYEASVSGIDQTFSKLRGLSTHCEKEIEEFEDEREDWNER